MQVQIKHSGTDITSAVLSYNREHNICTGVGTLTVEIERTIGRIFDPWDSIDVYENSDFKVRYYISAVRDSIPDGKIILECQDKSKKLVDFFIPTSYVIDYPSYTRYWIELFLDMAGVSYNFETTSQGNLLSNNTQLGMVNAYEQLLILLQLSGWYMYFDGNGVAVIGKLDADFADETNSLDTDDIISISVNQDDKMLRNRALVLGAFDPYSLTYATADITVRTRWNYDNRDVRAMVVVNSNIPNVSSAMSIANMLIKEFARITVVKTIEVHGARDFTLGNACRVNSNIWRGKGLITTFGVNMSKDGLTSTVILDERCPRLFGFFNFGDYVYVGTYGDGVWRKHLQFVHTWEDFSAGLNDLAVTDLHINNGIFGAVTASGEMNIANSSDGPWYTVAVSGLPSSLEAVPSGQIVYADFSGIMARTVIVDKISNTVKFGVDNGSGLNYGDYFLDFSGYMNQALLGSLTISGVTASGLNRGWILEYDPFTGQPVGGLGSGVYPISYSGSYDLLVLDLENDGKNDYVSVVTFSGGVTTYENGYDFGRHTSAPTVLTGDSRSKAGYSLSTYDLEGQSYYLGLSLAAYPIFSVFHNETIGEREILWVDNTSNVTTFRRTRFTRTFDEDLGYYTIGILLQQSAQVTLPAGGANTFRGIYKFSTDLYRYYYTNQNNGTSSTNGVLTLYYRDWNTATNSVGSEITVNTITDPPEPIVGKFERGSSQRTINDTIYTVYMHYSSDNGSRTVANRVILYYEVISMASASGTTGSVTFDFETPQPFPGTAWELESILAGNQFIGMLQKGNNPAFFMVLQEFNAGSRGAATILRNWLISSNDCINFTITKLQETNTSSDENFLLTTAAAFGEETTSGANQLTNDSFIVYLRDGGGTIRPTYAYDGSTLNIGDYPTDVPFQWKASNIYAMFNGMRNEFIAKDGSTWYWVNADTVTVAGSISLSSDYTIVKPFSTAANALEQFFWYATRNSDNEEVILITQRAGTIATVIDPFANFSFSNTRGIVSGNMFIDASTTGGVLAVLYIDNVYPPEGGSTYLVLQRDGMDYNLVQQAALPIRIDISNNSPLLTVQSGQSSFHSFFIYDREGVEVTPSFSGILVDSRVEDYRYTFLEPTYSGITASGLALQMMGLYVTGSGVYGFDVNTYSGGFQVLDEVPSGWGNRIETSNYGAGGQYIFVTTSGDFPDFYQKDPGQLAFVSYSGLPESRATIIRLDDRI